MLRSVRNREERSNDPLRHYTSFIARHPLAGLGCGGPGTRFSRPKQHGPGCDRQNPDRTSTMADQEPHKETKTEPAEPTIATVHFDLFPLGRIGGAGRMGSHSSFSGD